LTRRGITLIECLVTLVAASVILAGFASLFTVADLAARGNVEDVHGVAIDYNLDRVLGEIATATTGVGDFPTRKVYENVSASSPHTAAQPSCILVYERPISIRCSLRWAGAKGPPGSVPRNNTIPGGFRHPFPVFFFTENGSAQGMTNVDPTVHPENWLTGIVALRRGDPDGNGRFRTGILWHAEMTMRAFQLHSSAVPQLSLVESRSGAGYPTYLTMADVQRLAARDDAHRLFAGTRVLGIGIQSFEINGRPHTPSGDARLLEPMTWKVTR
jgi:hypothetical protein